MYFVSSSVFVEPSICEFAHPWIEVITESYRNLKLCNVIITLSFGRILPVNVKFTIAVNIDDVKILLVLNASDDADTLALIGFENTIGY